MTDNDCVPDGTQVISATNVRKYVNMADIIDSVETPFRQYQQGETMIPAKSTSNCRA
jgi:ornithine cyclodeaminase/alanine dehydrogenase-like protein (mu-crystallin family)